LVGCGGKACGAVAVLTPVGCSGGGLFGASDCWTVGWRAAGAVPALGVAAGDWPVSGAGGRGLAGREDVMGGVGAAAIAAGLCSCVAMPRADAV
jgi:hypothetical protein